MRVRMAVRMAAIAAALILAACADDTTRSTPGTTTGSGADTTTSTSAPATTTTTIPPAVSIPAPLPLQVFAFDGTPAPESGFTMTLFVGSPFRVAIGAARGFPEGCVGLSVFATDHISTYFDGYVPTTAGGCDAMTGTVPIDEQFVIARTDRSIVVQLGDPPPMPFFPAFQVMQTDGGGWYSLNLEQPIDPADIPVITAGYFTHFGGDLFMVPEWEPVVTPTPTGGSCVPDDHTLCLGGGRFQVGADWTSSDGSGRGTVLGEGGDEDGAFWFFTPDNWEMVVKVIDSCPLNNRFWVFAGGLTDIEVTITVTDTKAGPAATRVYTPGPTFPPITDTSAFATCP